MNRSGKSIFRPIRCGRISYVNVDPIYFGFDRGNIPNGVEFCSYPPDTLNRMMIRGELDISPVSSFACATHSEDWLILPNMAIACAGPVGSVLLASRTPMETLSGKTVVLSSESASAAALCRVILKKHGIFPRFRRGTVRTPEHLDASAHAALVIGDAALSPTWTHHFPYVWDLGEAWFRETGLPFVFAVWCVRKTFSDEHPASVRKMMFKFHQSLLAGLAGIEEIIGKAAGTLSLPHPVMRRYFHGLRYMLGKDEKKGLSRFFQDLWTAGEIPAPVAPMFFQPEQSKTMFTIPSPKKIHSERPISKTAL